MVNEDSNRLIFINKAEKSVEVREKGSSKSCGMVSQLSVSSQKWPINGKGYHPPSESWKSPGITANLQMTKTCSHGEDGSFGGWTL